MKTLTLTAILAALALPAAANEWADTLSESLGIESTTASGSTPPTTRETASAAVVAELSERLGIEASEPGEPSDPAPTAHEIAAAKLAEIFAAHE